MHAERCWIAGAVPHRLLGTASSASAFTYIIDILQCILKNLIHSSSLFAGRHDRSAPGTPGPAGGHTLHGARAEPQPQAHATARATRHTAGSGDALHC